MERINAIASKSSAGKSEGSPVSLILYGNDGQMWLSIVETPNQKANAKMVTAIRNALKRKLPD